MQRKVVNVWLVLAMCIISACGPSGVARNAQATVTAASIFATQTAQTPSPTLTPTKTPTPTPTKTPTPTPTKTPTPTPVWTSNGPEGGNIDVLAIDPQTSATLYAGTWGGVFKSTDGGGNWSAVNAGLTDFGVYALAIDPQTPTTLYAGTYGGVFFIQQGVPK